MRNYINNGDVIAVVAGGDVLSGGVYEGGGSIGVYVRDAATGETVQVAMKGQYTLAALSTDAWVPGDQLYWDATEDELTDTAAGNIPAGKAGGVKGAGDTTARVIIG